MLAREINKEIVIDGSQGEGGGQIFRTSLTLALCLGGPIRIENIRAGRRKPGLLRQHLTCLRAAADISSAEVIGAELGASCVRFTPGVVRGGNYEWAIGSAGSTTLVFQTIALPLALTGEPSTITLQGGTHNGMAPSVDFIEQSYLPLLKKMGIDIAINLQEHGFYPNGGGLWKADIAARNARHACKRPLSICQRGELKRVIAVATSAHIPAHITQRELAVLQRKLELCSQDMKQQLVNSAGPGNCVSVRAHYENVCAVFETLGERGRAAEKVANDATKLFRRWERGEVAVDQHLADQLLLPMLLTAGGEFTTARPSKHLTTNIDVIRQITGASIDLYDLLEGKYRVRIPSSDEEWEKQ